jgi:Mn-containing catalase
MRTQETPGDPEGFFAAISGKQTGGLQPCSCTTSVSCIRCGSALPIRDQSDGPDGELAAAMRYFTQGLAEIDPGRKDLCSISPRKNSAWRRWAASPRCSTRASKGKWPKGSRRAQLLANISGGIDSHTTALLNGGGVALTNSAGVPWSAAYVDSRTEPTAEIRSNIAAEARAKIIYQRLVNATIPM